MLSSESRKLLMNSGNVIYAKAIEKTKDEYRKYQVVTLSPVEKQYGDNKRDR